MVQLVSGWKTHINVSARASAWTESARLLLVTSFYRHFYYLLLTGDMEFIGFHVGLWIEISGFEPKSGHCVAFFDRSLSFHKIPFHSGVFMDSGKMCLKLLGRGEEGGGEKNGFCDNLQGSWSYSMQLCPNVNSPRSVMGIFCALCNAIISCAFLPRKVTLEWSTFITGVIPLVSFQCLVKTKSLIVPSSFNKMDTVRTTEEKWGAYVQKPATFVMVSTGSK